MTDTFTWPATGTTAGTSTYSVLVAKYGDGYSQEAANGINNRTRSWPVTFMGSKAYIDEIMNFLDDHGGAIGFNWQPPIGKVGIFKAASCSPAPLGGGTWSLTTTFEEKFAP